MTAQAIRLPAFPLAKLAAFPPLPQSSSSSCMIRPRPMTFALVPLNFTWSSVMRIWQFPSLSATKFPKSPTWRSFIPGQPWVFPYGFTRQTVKPLDN